MGISPATGSRGAEREAFALTQLRSTSDKLDLAAFVTHQLESDPEFRRIWEDPKRKIGRDIQFRRHQLGWSQRELARRVGTSANQIHVIEKGEGNPTVETLKRLANELGLQLEVDMHLPMVGGR